MTSGVDEQATVTVRGACPHDCPDTCAMLVSVRDGRAIGVRGDPEHPFTRGGLCVKVNNYVDKVCSPDRVLYPLRRTGPKGSIVHSRFILIWACNMISTNLHQPRPRHGQRGQPVPFRRPRQRAHILRQQSRDRTGLTASRPPGRSG